MPTLADLRELEARQQAQAQPTLADLQALEAQVAFEAASQAAAAPPAAPAAEPAPGFPKPSLDPRQLVPRRNPKSLLSVAEGATFGFSTPVIAAAQEAGEALGLAEPAEFEARKAALEARRKQFEAESPGTALAAEIAGAIPTGGLLAGLGRRAVAAGPGLVRQTVRGGIEGAGMGGLYGLGKSEPGKEAEQALVGAALGGAAGTVLPLVIRAATGARDLWRGIAGGPKAAAERSLTRTATGGTTTLDDLRREAQHLDDPNLMLADLSPELQAATEAVVSTRQPGGFAAQKALTERSSTQKQPGKVALARIRRTFRDVIAKRKSYSAARREIDDAVKAIARPAYDEAFTLSVSITPDIQATLRSPAGRRALAHAVTTARNESVSERFTLDESELANLKKIALGQTVPDAKISVRMADYMKSSLDDIEEVEKARVSTPATPIGKTTRKGRSIGNVRRTLVAAVDDGLGGRDPAANPYFRARQAYEGAAKNNDALQTGKLATRYELDELREKVAAMTPGERIYLRVGFMRPLAAALRRPGKRAERILKDPALQEKMQVVLGSDYKKVVRMLGLEKTFAETEAIAVSGSPTARRQAAQEALATEEGPAVQAGLSLLSGRPAEAVRTVMASPVRSLTQPSPEKTAAMAELLQARGTPDILSALNILQRRQSAEVPMDPARRAQLASLLTGVPRPMAEIEQ